MGFGAFGGLLIGAGILLPVVVLLAHNRWSKQKTWISAKAVVIDSVVAYDGEQFVPRVTYEYDYAGQTFRGTVVRAGILLYNWRAPAEELCRQYSPGTLVTAYVDPTNPEAAVLEPGGDARLIPLALVAGIVLVVVGGLFAAAS
jgi:hypothetical protein